jgi:hypothetical protein
MSLLRIVRDETAICVEVSLLHARVIGLLATWGFDHCKKQPEHTPIVLARLVQSIEAALQETPYAHAAWCRLCQEMTPIRVFVSDLDGRDGNSTPPGGDGGGGAWPGGGGGGGGGGAGGTGGSGGAGALLKFLLSADGKLVDVDALVMPGTITWTVPRDVVKLLIYGCGGAGGGGGGTRRNNWVRGPIFAPTAFDSPR